MTGQNLRRMGTGLLALFAGWAFAGELPSVTFSGAEFIRTDVVPTVDMRVVCDFQLLELPQGNNVAGVFGSLGTAANNISVNTGWGFRAQGPNNAGMGGWAGKFIGWSGNDGQPMAPIDLARHKVELASGRVVLDGQTNTCGAARRSFRFGCIIGSSRPRSGPATSRSTGCGSFFRPTRGRS